MHFKKNRYTSEQIAAFTLETLYFGLHREDSNVARCPKRLKLQGSQGARLSRRA